MRTQWTFEVPFKHLEDFEPYQDFHMVLSSQWWLDFSYRSYYRDLYTKGLKTIWLDNGWNEQGYSDDLEVLHTIDEDIHPSKIILPDVIPRYTEPLLRVLKAAARLGIDGQRAVPVVSHQRTLRVMSSFASTVAVPYRQRQHMSHNHLLHFRGTHFLGCNSTDEIKLYTPLSVDTSMPLKLAIKHLTWDKWKRLGWPHTHTDSAYFFSKKLTQSEVDLAVYNIIRFKEESGCGAT